MRTALIAALLVLAPTCAYAADQTVDDFVPCMRVLLAAPNSNDANLCWGTIAEVNPGCTEADRRAFIKAWKADGWPGGAPLKLTIEATYWRHMICG